jgi:hypothetical protein
MKTYAALLAFIESEVKRAKEWDRMNKRDYGDLCQEVLINIDREIRKYRKEQAN